MRPTDAGGAPAWPFVGRAHICVSLAEPDLDALLARFDRLSGADLVEVRLDALDDPSTLGPELFAALRAASPVPVGLTLRPRRQGGGFEGDEDRRRNLIEQASHSRPAFVDVELDAEWVADFIALAPCPVVASHHWFDGVPDDLDDYVARVRELRPSMAKLVATANSPADALPLLEVGAALISSGRPATCFCMGDAGKASRLIAAARGAALVYCAADGAREVAEGQWPLRRLVDEMRVGEWPPGAKLCGLIGHPIGHSLSPAIFNAVFQQMQEPFAYLPLPGDDFDSMLDLVEGTGFAGLSVTMPFKQAAAQRAVERDALVAATGAANTMIAGGGSAGGDVAARDRSGDDAERPQWSAFNTDAEAVVEALAEVLEVDDAAVAVIGAGGAACAAAAALQIAGASVTVFARKTARAEEVADRTGAAAAPLETLADRRFDIVVNATPVGMAGTSASGETPFPVAWLSGSEVVFDMVYRPRATPLLRQAAAKGCTTVAGLEMFVRQAAAQYRLLTGDSGDAPLAALREAAEQALVNDDNVAHISLDSGTTAA